MKYWAVGLLLAVIVAGALHHSRRSTVVAPPAGAASQARSAEPARKATVDAGLSVGEVRLLPKAEREALGERITAAMVRARAAANAQGSPRGAVAAYETYPEIQDAGPVLLQALEQAIPHLSVCYPKSANGVRPPAAARMTMFSDPEAGTVIDTDAITGPDGGVIDPKLDTCLRDVIDSLALPPLAKPGRLKLEYTFRFD